MRLSGWRSRAPGRGGIDQKVIDAVASILAALGAEPDAHCWVTFGDETGSRWTLMAPTQAGLVAVNVRPGAPGEGPRAGGRLIRWTKAQLGELAAETEHGHRIVMFQIEGQPVRGVDDDADEVAAFARLAIAGLEGGPLPDLDAGGRRPDRPAAPPLATSGARGGARSGAKPGAKPGHGSGPKSGGTTRIPARASSNRPPTR